MNKKLSPGRRAYTAGMKALMYASTAAIGALVLFFDRVCALPGHTEHNVGVFDHGAQHTERHDRHLA